jgi:hypothetical protein
MKETRAKVVSLKMEQNRVIHQRQSNIRNPRSVRSYQHDIVEKGGGARSEARYAKSCIDGSAPPRHEVSLKRGASCLSLVASSHSRTSNPGETISVLGFGHWGRVMQKHNFEMAAVADAR